MINRKKYWKEHPSENERLNSFARLAIGQAETGPELARCAQLLVGSGLGSDLVTQLWEKLIRRVVDVADMGSSQEALADAASVGEAMTLLAPPGSN
jgi:hypothetical protein